MVRFGKLRVRADVFLQIRTVLFDALLECLPFCRLLRGVEIYVDVPVSCVIVI